MNLTTALCDRKGENTFPEAGCSPERKACSVLPERVLYFTVQYALAGRNIQKVLDSNEVNLYQKFLDMKKDGHGILNDKKTTMERIWNMGVKYGAFSNDRSMKEILCGKGKDFNTLGSILKSAYARSRIRVEYLQILDFMFDKKKLNLRNSIAHGISTTYDYLSIGFVGVMVQIIWDIGTNDVILGYEFR